MAVMEALLRMQYAEQQVINRWNFVSSGTPAAVSLSFALASALGVIPGVGGYDPLTMIGWMVGTLSDQAFFLELQTRDIYSVTDFYTTPFPADTHGEDAADSGSPFDAYGFRTNRIRSDVARGTKRLVGVVEPYVGDTGLLTPTGLGFMNNGAAIMSEVLEYDDEGNTLTFTPSVCGKQRYEPTPETVAYKYYPTAAEQLAKTAVGVTWQPYNSLRSQVSRQRGHGR